MITVKDTHDEKFVFSGRDKTTMVTGAGTLFVRSEDTEGIVGEFVPGSWMSYRVENDDITDSESETLEIETETGTFSVSASIGA